MAWTAPHTFAVGEAVTAATLNTYVTNNLSAVAPTGSMQYVCALSAGAATESQWQGGWLETNGAVVSRTTYSTLSTYFSGLSTPYPFGAGNGSTTFVLPDFRGRVPIHHGGQSDVATVGNNDGVTDANRRPKHRHTAHTHTGGNDTTSTTGSGGSTSSVGSSGAAVTGSKDGGSGVSTDSLDAPAYLVAGIWVIKF